MTDLPTPQLLVSVRSADEARAALAGGADLVDVKEPSRGPLGAADSDVIAEVLRAVKGRLPVSAALGEFAAWRDRPVPPGLHFAKWGMAGQKVRPSRAVVRIRTSSYAHFPVLVAYADHRRAESPDPEWLAGAAVRYHFPAFLIDTAVKDGSTLLDWIAPAALARLRFELGDARVPVALAGSLDEAAIRTLGPLHPDWFAVRGAACTGGRTGAVCADRVRRLKQIISEVCGAIAG
jgi:(5-formylfuran-3-yl)methyl phosphate synthase